MEGWLGVPRHRRRQPVGARNAFQRVYDMILSYGSEPFQQFKQEYIRYTFFADPIDNGADAIFGLERPLMQLVDFFKSAAQGYGTEKRILLLHGPVGSSKSTIARLLKKGIEHYSKTDAGKCYTYIWRLPRRAGDGDEAEQLLACPMHEEPLLLIPREARQEVLDSINEKLPTARRSASTGRSAVRRKVMDDLMTTTAATEKVMEHVKVKRLILSEKDRRGIGTFQPRREEQDSTSSRATSTTARSPSTAPTPTPAPSTLTAN